MSHSDILNTIIKDGVFSSIHILQQIVYKYSSLIKEIDQIKVFAPYSKISLQEAYEKLPYHDQVFLLRSTPVRIIIDQLYHICYMLQCEGASLEAIKSSEGFGKLAAMYSTLSTIIVKLAYSETLVKQDPIARFREIGFDSRYCLTAPFPLVTCCWDNENSNEIWSESSELLKYYKELKHPFILQAFSPFQVELIRNVFLEMNYLSDFLLHDIAMNVRHICLFTGSDLTSMTHIPISYSHRIFPSCIFVSSGAFEKPVILLEQIFHEALHVKYVNTSLSVPIFKDSYNGDSGSYFFCAWKQDSPNETDKYWLFDRAFAALHVYIHIFILYGVAQEKNKFEIDWMVCRRREIHKKSNMLISWLVGEVPKVMSSLGEEYFKTLVTAYSLSVELLQP